jgi:ADA HAT complex component 1
MQSIFRLPSLPWSPGSALDKKAAFTPIIELPSSTKAKRKRAAHSPGSSPKPVLKKAKPSDGGAVQGLAQQPARVVDGASADWAQRTNPAPRADGYPHATPPRSLATGAVPTTSTLAQGNPSDLTSAPHFGQAPRVPSAMAHQAAAIKESVKSAARLPASSLPSNHVATAMAPLHQQPRPPKQQDMAQTKPAMPLNKDVLRAIVEAEINHAILFKHNELRLIEQEIAKCQTGLEQIRRCQLIPFPGSQGMSLDQVNHTGPALVAPNGLTPPADPAPWGVTDGPYSRHYSSWLLPSPRFDPHAPDAATPMPLNSPLPKDGRITRGSTDVASPLAASHYQTARAARATGARTRASLDTMSPTPPRDPLVIKRQKDGQWVKLYCTQCLPERSDFANVQGFLNHCRISHKLDFKSHEAAAIECGRVVEHHDYFGGATPTSATAGPEKAPLHSQVNTPLRDTGVLQPRPALTLSFPPSPAPMLDRPAVHPLNRTLLSARDRRPPPAQQITPRTYSASQAKTPHTLNHTPNFRPATDAPFLSSLLGKRGYSGDMDHLVKNAKSRVDLSVYDDESEEPEDAGKKPASPAKANSKSNSKSARPGQHTPRPASTPTARARAGGAGARRKAPAASLPLARVPPTLAAVASADSPASTTDAEMSPQTADSNPGLVSDRDDEDDEEEEEEVDGEGQQQARDPDEMVVVIEGSDGEGSTRRGVGVICSARG